MGSGKWSDRDYDARETDRKIKGVSAFAHSDNTTRNVPRDQWKVHDKLDPKGVTRESRDSANHPESVSIAVAFDVTGSMRDVPRILQKGLPKLMGLLLQKRWIEHPQILFGAVGDATCDRVPLQIGQFESDIAMEGDLERFLLEGGGGGQAMESYELAIYMASRHFSIDCWEKRKRKGYLFLIGDEMPYSRVKNNEVTSIIGDNVTLFQGATLGGTGKETGKRHPTIGNNVVVGAGAKVLGNIEIGDNSYVGANAVVIKSVPPNATVVGVPGRITRQDGKKIDVSMDHIHILDPVMQQIDELNKKISDLEGKLKEK